MRFFAALFVCVILIGGGCAVREEGDRVSNTTQEAAVIAGEQRHDDRYDAVTSTFTLPILLYHHIGPRPSHISASNDTWYVSEKKFRADLEQIQALGYQTAFFADILEGLEDNMIPKDTVVITFDDGAKDFMTNAFPLLQEFDMKSTMFLQSHVRSSNWLSEDDIQTLHASGLVEFGSHTKYHEYLTRVSDLVAREEIEGSKAKIESLIDQPIEVLSYPFGLYNDRVETLVEESGYKMGLTIDSGITQDIDDVFSMKRIIVTEQLDLTNILP